MTRLIYLLLRFQPCFFVVAFKSALSRCIRGIVKGNTTRNVRGSDYSPAIELSEQKDKLVTATGETEK